MKYICLHGHFYQPPRENPYTEKISLQESAYPFRDWNERINFESYGPNGHSRLLNDQQKITKIINNYQYISFNFGPTLLSWLKINSKTTYESILEADKKSLEKFDGHGSAIAQVYNHIIMPFANRNDKEIQIKWGIKDFYFHYNRKPEGMWLSETAVDTETLEVLAENDIKFTILSPYQAKAIKETYDQDYKPIKKENLNTNKPYKVLLPSGKEIIIFFYQGDLAHQLSFGDLLKNGGQLFEKLKSHLNFNNDDTELLNIALDGETFGHHHKHGDMALAYCINKIENSSDIHIVNYGKFLDLYNTTTLVEIHENTSWSCSHGIQRWYSNCGCRGDGGANWNQEWRTPLRDALNFVNYKANELFEELAKPYFNNNLTEALYNYIDVILNRSKEKSIDFFRIHTKKQINDADLILLSRLFEMKRNCQLMFTSCGWFFSEISGLETVQILMFADRVLQIFEAITTRDCTEEFLSILRKAKSNIIEFKDGEWIYKNYVRINRKNLSHIGMIQAFYYINENNFKHLDEQNTKVEVVYSDQIVMGYSKVLVGEFKLQSKVTYSNKYFYFSLIQISRANFVGYYTITEHQITNPVIENNILENVKNTNLPTLLEINKKAFDKSFSLIDLLKEEQTLILKIITEKEQLYVNRVLEDIYLRNYRLCLQFYNTGIKLPNLLHSNIEIVLMKKLSEGLNVENLNVKNLNKTIEEIKKWNINILPEEEDLKLKCSYLFKSLFSKLKKDINNKLLIETINDLMAVILPLKLDLNLWSSQNTFFKIIIENKKIFLELKIKNIYTYNLLINISNYLNIDMDYVIQH